MIHMTNWVLNGLPERFPKLKVLCIESGLARAGVIGSSGRRLPRSEALEVFLDGPHHPGDDERVVQ